MVWLDFFVGDSGINYLGCSHDGKKKQSRSDHRNQHHEEDALDILNKRYARGEITRDEYERLKDDLE